MRVLPEHGTSGRMAMGKSPSSRLLHDLACIGHRYKSSATIGCILAKRQRCASTAKRRSSNSHGSPCGASIPHSPERQHGIDLSMNPDALKVRTILQTMLAKRVATDTGGRCEYTSDTARRPLRNPIYP